MAGKLERRVGLITGTATGIGRAGALLFAREGAALVTMDTNAAKGEAIRRASSTCRFQRRTRSPVVAFGRA